MWNAKNVVTLKHQTTETMTTITNTTGTKAVNISTDATNTVRAMYVQIYKGQQQVLQAKSFAKIASAKKWATKILN